MSAVGHPSRFQVYCFMQHITISTTHTPSPLQLTDALGHNALMITATGGRVHACCSSPTLLLSSHNLPIPHQPSLSSCFLFHHSAFCPTYNSLYVPLYVPLLYIVYFLALINVPSGIVDNHLSVATLLLSYQNLSKAFQLDLDPFQAVRLPRLQKIPGKHPRSGLLFTAH